jgi:transposase
MVDGSGSATSLLGLDGFVVRAQVLTDGEWWLSVETAAALGCPDCGVRATGHGRPKVQVRDLPIGGVPVRLVWSKRRGKCLDPDCERKTFTEQSPQIEGSLTHRARAEICRRVGEDGRTVAELAREFGVGWWTAMAAVRDHGTPLVEDPGRMAGVRFLGVDEHKMLSATRRHRTFYATSIVDIGHGRLLDVIPGRNADDVAFWCALAPGSWRQRIDAVAIDPHRGYLRGLLAYLPDAMVTVDCFHGVKLANTMVDDVRRRVQQETLGQRGHKVDPLYATRRLMTRGWERMTDKQRTKLFAALAAGDPDGEVGAAILGKELVREMYAARSLTAARWKLVAFYHHAADAEIPELTRLAKTVAAWETEILNYHVTGISNGPTEAQNLITEKIRRTAHGFRNFHNYRLRLLLHSGVEWNTQPTARIRGRNPRLVA